MIFRSEKEKAAIAAQEDASEARAQAQGRIQYSRAGPSADPPPYSAPAPSSSPSPSPAHATSGSRHSSSPSTSTLSALVSSPNSASSATPKNYVHIHQVQQAVNGVFYIDPALRVPPWMLPPLESGRFTRPNLSLRSQHSCVSATVVIVDGPNGGEFGMVSPNNTGGSGNERLSPGPWGGTMGSNSNSPGPAPQSTLHLPHPNISNSPNSSVNGPSPAPSPSHSPSPNSAPKRVLLEATSAHGNVTIAVPSRASYTFYLKVASAHGNIIVRLPPDFRGPIRYTAENDRVRFTPKLSERMSIVTQGGKRGSCFVGEWEGHGGPGHGGGSNVNGGGGEWDHQYGYGNQNQNGGTISKTSSRANGPAGGNWQHQPPPMNQSNQMSPTTGEWEGDEVDVEGGHGKIKFCLWGETKEESEAQMTLRHLKEDGPIASIVKLVKRTVEHQLTKPKV
ncbi:hypothetical protein BOTBODRAFT_192995 [Botryobasidium botryosum FD-172 SS1]|uniref:DUF7330 domain-containing protein n=1 Tax=Botryobasidium botryosum (strain FD-172 SS1) TaxID=930990 RepID=A0A067M4Q0_BOTB1|nr:hypothetical protein BOTBODRAFT_192995 [Botryobasidium botryosum FD-172 SS1]